MLSSEPLVASDVTDHPPYWSSTSASAPPTMKKAPPGGALLILMNWPVVSFAGVQATAAARAEIPNLAPFEHKL